MSNLSGTGRTSIQIMGALLRATRGETVQYITADAADAKQFGDYAAATLAVQPGVMVHIRHMPSGEVILDTSPDGQIVFMGLDMLSTQLVPPVDQRIVDHAAVEAYELLVADMVREQARRTIVALMAQHDIKAGEL